MSRQTEIVFSARDTGVESTMSRLRNSSNELGRGMLQDAAKFSSTAKDAIKYYEDQIRLIEKRNRTEAKDRTQQVQSKRDDALEQANTPDQRADVQKQYKERVADIKEGSREDELQVDLLRELIETVKTTAQREAASDDVDAVRNAMTSERQILSNAGQEFEGLSNKYREELQGGGSSQSRSRGTAAVGMYEDATGLMTNPSIQGASGLGGGMLKKAGPWGRAAAATLALGTGSFLALAGEDKSLADISSVSGKSLRNLKDDEFGLGWADSLNMKREEFINRSTMTSRAYGGRGSQSLEAMTYKQVQLEKAFGLQTGSADEIAVLTRTLSEAFDSRSFMKDLYSAMADTGVLGKSDDDMSRMNAIVGTATSLATDQLMRAGATGLGDNLITLRAMSQLGGSFENDTYLQSAMSGVDRGLSTPGGAETQALKYNLLRQLNPDADVFDLETMMQQGLGTEGYLQAVLGQVNNLSGSSNLDKKILLQQMLPGVGNDVIKQMVENPAFSLEEYQQKGVSIETKQKETFSPALQIQLGMVDSGKELLADFADSIFEFNRTIEKMSSWFGAGGSNSPGN